MNNENPILDTVEILIVDDREENLMALEVALQSPNYRLVRARSGDQALRYLLDHSPALILLDVQMPDLDGYETAALIKGRERTRTIPIIFLTALNDEERYVQKGYEYGAVDYLIKPFDTQILRSKVRIFAELHNKTQQLLKYEREAHQAEAHERERRLAALELKSLKRERLQQKNYQELIEGIEHGIVWVATTDMRTFTYIGPTAERMLGYSPEQWRGERGFWLQHIHKDDAEIFDRRCRQAIEDRQGFSLEHRFHSANGQIVWLQTGIRVTKCDIHGLELRGLSVDITRLKTAEESLTKSNQRSNLLAQTSLNLGSSFEIRECLTLVAKKMVAGFAAWFSVDLYKDNRLQTFCLERHGLTDQPEVLKEFDLHAPELHSQNDTSLVFETEKPVHRGELTVELLRQAAGSELRAQHMAGLQSLVTFPIMLQGRSLGAMTIGSMQPNAFDAADITFMTSLASRIGLASENARLYREAKEAIGLRDEFLSIASHELKTPLTPLKLQIQQLIRILPKSNQLEPDMISKMLGMSNRQISRLSGLIDELLDISKLSRGQLQLDPEKFSLVELINDIVQRFARQLEDTKCTLHLSLGPDLPVHWDRARIEQVIVNLLTNAIKYAPGKPIHIRAEQKGSLIVISVRDEGMGIAPQDQARIFKRFERAVSHTHFGGMGLGLYIVSQIVELHQGKIEVESQLHKGATFRVEIPADPSAVTAELVAVP